MFEWWKASTNVTQTLIETQFSSTTTELDLPPYKIVPIYKGSKIYQYGVLLYTVQLKDGNLDIDDNVANQTATSPLPVTMSPDVSSECVGSILEMVAALRSASFRRKSASESLASSAASRPWVPPG